MPEQTPPQAQPGKATTPADGIFERHEPAYAECLAGNPREDFNKRLAEAYGDVDWSEADKVFLRASGLI